MVTHLGSLVQLCCGEGETLQTSITGVCGECLQCLGHIGFAPVHGVCAFPVCTAQAPSFSAGELSKVGPGLRAHLRSKLLRFGCSGTPQRHRLDWGCVLCPSWVRAAWRVHSLQVGSASYHLPRPSCLNFWMRSGSAVSDVPCVSSGKLISGCDPPARCQPSRIPRRAG